MSVTGLFLTVSSTWLEGRYYSALNTIHALTVILGLMYIPFGKLFHIFQRPANLGVQYYKRAERARRAGRPVAAAANRSSPPSTSPTSRTSSTSSASTTDRPTTGDSYQDTCPACRRRQVALAQSVRVGGFG